MIFQKQNPRSTRPLSKESLSKASLGQFFTTNAEYILQGFENTIVGKQVLDPFAGNGDLLKWAEKNGARNVRGLDIDPELTNDQIGLNDSLLAIPQADMIITNPPYLAKNKMSPERKEKINLGSLEDLYLLSMDRVLASGTTEGIIIVPINFLSAENSDELR
jgi:tRNA G10  N-methylase Trm11